MAIRYKPGELDALQKQIRRYNAKISRMAKKGIDLGMGSLPERASMRTAKGFTSRAELRDYQKQMERVLKKGSEQLVKTKGGVVIPKYERDQINALNARINRRRQAAAKKANEARARGDLPLMGRIKDNEARVRKSLSSVTPAGYAAYKTGTLTMGDVRYIAERDRAYKENYKKMIRRLFTEEDAAELEAVIDTIPDKEFRVQTINHEEISFSIGSPTTNTPETVSSLMLTKFREVFPEKFKGLYFSEDDPLDVLY
jgi:hypothetical protein